MLKNIIKQVWNQRRQNGWILLELIIAGFFLWTVIDPVYVLTVNHFTPKGYEEDGRYVLRFGAYGEKHGMRDTTVTKEQQRTAIDNMLRLVRDCPEVESALLVQNSSFPNGGSWNGTTYYADTLKSEERKYVNTQEYTFNNAGGGNLFKTYGMKNALTGGDIEVPQDAGGRNLIYVSENFARHMFGTTDAVGKKVYDYRDRAHEIAAVFKDYKHRDFEPIYPLIISINNKVGISPYMHWTYMIAFNLKEGVDEDAFVKRFEKEVAPNMAMANFFFDRLLSFEKQRTTWAKQSGTYNVIRLKLALASFALLCIFLGMVGTFWIRCNARRQEIGLMRSLGATKKGITSRFLTEATLLITAAFVVSLIILVHYAMQDNMAKFQCTGDMEFMSVNWFMEENPHFLMVSVITYLALLVIAWVGTLIPVIRATKVLPADALRDE